MRVLYVSKASIVPAYQDKLRALAQHADVYALVPTRWGRSTFERGAPGAARIITAAVLCHGHNHLHVHRRARSVLRDVGPDIVHIDEEPYSAVTWQFARCCVAERVPFVFFAWQNLRKRMPQPFRALQRYVLAHAAAGIAGSERAGELLRAAGLRAPLEVLPQLGVDPDRFVPAPEARAATRARLGLPRDAFVAGFAGRLVREKGVDLLIDAAVRCDRLHLLIVGEGRERAALERLATRRGVRSRTHFAGIADSLTMPCWLNAMDALVLPSREARGWIEQFGRVLIEAMACGVPVIGAASGEIPHVIGEAGLTFPEDDVASLALCLERLVSDAELRAGLARAGRARVLERFTNDHIARATLALYARLAGQRVRA